MLLINSKENSLKILSKYFKKYSVKEINYYFNNFKNINLIDFLKENIIEKDDIYCFNIFFEHFTAGTL